ncbi:hypothetical protein [Roseixanthobacter glucoisosaccharinicivorans]|uniref:hypothetical protein n=1 Tax=Roseixanthobacter glucoisosaccharinicivorans TaxID=3119923 RepID=UPI00372C6E8D
MLTGPRIIAGRRPLEIVRLIGVSALQGPSYGSGAAALTLEAEAGARCVRRASGAADLALAAAGGARRARRLEAAAGLALSQVGASRRVARASGAAALSLGGSGGALSLDAGAAAVIARMSASPSFARKTAINTLVRALKAAGVWQRLDVLHIMAAHDAQAARLNWISSSYDLTATNSPTFTVDRGYQGDGATNFLTATGYDPSAGGRLLTLNSATLGAWVETADVTTSTGGILVFTSTGRLQRRLNGTQYQCRVNDATSANIPVGAFTGSTGLNRSAAGAREFYQAGVQTLTDTVASGTVSNRLDYLAAGLPASAYSDARLAAGWAGGSLTSAQQTALHAALRAYMTSVGVA